jgi:hypothetical protein
MRSPEEHFADLEAILEKHATALESEVRRLQQADETHLWPNAWKQIYNWRFANAFARQKVLYNWATDAAGWKLLPERKYPNKGNRNED